MVLHSKLLLQEELLMTFKRGAELVRSDVQWDGVLFEDRWRN
jgi:hypothetical protein